jgi:ankyrin repeat protein
VQEYKNQLTGKRRLNMEKVKSVFFGHALIHAIKSKNSAVASGLIRSGADVWLEEDGYNALNWAINMQKFDIIKEIFSANQEPGKADLNLSLTNFGYLIFATTYSEISYFIGEKVIGAPVCISKIPIRYVRRKKNYRLLEYWIKKVRDINEVNIMGHSGIALCASYGEFERVKLLLDNGADIQRRDNKGHSALYHAVIGAADKRTIKLLLDNGLRLNNEEVPGKIENVLDKKPAIDRLIKSYKADSDMVLSNKGGPVNDLP